MGDRTGEQFGNYRLVRLLGSGGFADVYLGQHIHLGSQMAIKLLHTRLLSQDQESFLREARTIASLEHPSIIRVIDCGIERDIPFIIMNYASLGTLRQRHPKGSILPLATIIPYVKQVASALHYAHERKLVHRDVKPENMLLGRKNEVLLSDFGVALVTSTTAQSTKEVAGTVAYMAPEQIMGKPCAASDQYALAMVVYEWLTGTLPFHGSFHELYGQHLYAAPRPLHEHSTIMAPGINTAVLRALAKEPQQRFPGVQQFAETLEKCFLASSSGSLLHPLPSNTFQTQPNITYSTIPASSSSRSSYPSLSSSLPNSLIASQSYTTRDMTAQSETTDTPSQLAPTFVKPVIRTTQPPFSISTVVPVPGTSQEYRSNQPQPALTPRLPISHMSSNSALLSMPIKSQSFSHIVSGTPQSQQRKRRARQHIMLAASCASLLALSISIFLLLPFIVQSGPRSSSVTPAQPTMPPTVTTTSAINSQPTPLTTRIPQKSVTPQAVSSTPISQPGSTETTEPVVTATAIYVLPTFPAYPASSPTTVARPTATATATRPASPTPTQVASPTETETPTSIATTTNKP